MSSKCSQCGTEIDVTSPYCPACGAEIALGNPGKEEVTLCHKCGYVNAPDTFFCRKCGTKIGESDEESEDIDITHAGSEVYLKWEGWPFATFRTVTQTYDQFMRQMYFIVGFLAIIGLLSVLGGQPFGGLAILVIFACVYLFIWYVGRMGAEGESPGESTDEVEAELSPKDMLRARR